MLIIHRALREFPRKSVIKFKPWLLDIINMAEAVGFTRSIDLDEIIEAFVIFSNEITSDMNHKLLGS